MPLPSDMPMIGMLVSIARRRKAGAISAVRAMTLGSTPPRPIPVRKRSVPSCHSVRQQAAQRHEPVENRAHDDDPLAAEAIADVTQEHGAEHHAQQVCRHAPAPVRRPDPPVLGQARRGEGQHLQVEAIAQQREQQQTHDEYVTRRKRLPVDQVINVYGRGFGHSFISLRRTRRIRAGNRRACRAGWDR